MRTRPTSPVLTARAVDPLAARPPAARPPVRIPLLLVPLLLVPAPAHAQTGIVRGLVLNAEGQVPEPAFVRVLDLDVGTPVSTPSGRFELGLAAGVYTLVAESPGYSQKRMDAVEVAADEVTEVTFTMESFSNLLDPVNVTAEPWRSEPSSSSPARVAIVPGERVREWGGPTLVEAIRTIPGMDVAQVGLTPSAIVGRGFNNVFSGSLLVLSDFRYARLPSLRFNAYNMIPTTILDVERIELVLGPAAALYGPNSANGVMHIVTSSPIDRPGTEVSTAGGERDSFQGAFRHASRLGESAGLKVSGQIFRGTEWEYVGPVEESGSAEDPPAASPDPGTRRFSGDVRLDVRPWGEDAGEIVLAGGMNVLDGIELTPLGAARATDWRYQYAHARLQKGGLFAQAFVNRTDAEDTRLLRTGGSIVDRSRSIAVQSRYSFRSGEDQEWVAGIDLQRTEPRTGGTITGENEDHDGVDEVGGYLHSRTTLSDQADLVTAVRVDKHNRLEDPNVSPRVAFLFTPEQGHTLRLTYNRAFNTPTTNNLFLDLVAGRIPLGGGLGYDVRAVGTPSTGLTYRDRCDGGFEDLCMLSPFAEGRLPADGALVWDRVLDLLAGGDESLARVAELLANPGAAPGDPLLLSDVMIFDQESGTFVPAEAPRPVDPLRSTTTNTIELGYKGLVADRLSLSVDAYSSSIRDFVGPLRVETPSVFLTPASVEAYVTHRLAPLLASGEISPAEVAGIVEDTSRVPLGTVAPDQRGSPDVLVLSRNFGDVKLWGLDLGLELHATDEVTLTGSFSWVSENCFDFDEDDACSTNADISLNAPAAKGSLGARYASVYSPLSLGARMRWVDGFPVNSGSFVGNVDGDTIFDAHLGLRLPSLRGARVSLVARNLLDTRHREFVGAPELGRLAFLRLEYSF